MTALVGVLMPTKRAAGRAGSGVDALRVYVVTLRKAQRISQNAIAHALGMSRRAYINWEKGETEDLRLTVARQLLQLVGGTIEHLDELDRMSLAEAQAFAEQWASLSTNEKARAVRARAKLQRIIELADDDPARLESVVQQLRADTRADPELLDAISAYLDGRRSSRR